MAVVLPGSLLGLTAAPASAAPLPAAYSGSAHADIVDLSADLLAPLAPGSVADVEIGHSRSAVTSAASGSGSSTATSSNLDADLLFGNVPIQTDSQTATAPPSSDPAPETLAPVPLAPLADIGLVQGDTQAAWSGGDSCVPGVNGTRTLSQSRTTLARSTVGTIPAFLPGVSGALVDVEASETRTGTYLVDDGAGGSDVLSSATTTVGDVELLGGLVTVDVTHPVVLQARSDGTTGSAGYASPPTVVATIQGNQIPIPLNSQPRTIALPSGLDALVDLTITAFQPTQQSAGATGRATLDALFRVDLEVITLPAPAPRITVADVSLAVAPSAVDATAPSGGVECDSGPQSGAPAAPDITSPAAGAVVTDSTPAISGTGQPGATVTVREGDTVLCTAVVRQDRTWSCSPSTPLGAGPHTVTATQTDDNGTASGSDSVTFTVVPDPTDPDGDGLPNGQETAEGTNPNNPDTDGDGLTDGAEVTTHGTDPLDADTDDDGLTDGAEVTTHGTDPLDADTDNDGLGDGAEVKGVQVRERFEVCGTKARKSITVTTDPLRKDTDKDGLSDGREVTGYKIKQKVKTRKGSFVIGRTRSNPTKKDTDRDGLKDKVETTGKANKRFGKAKTDPTKCDTDRGGVRDGAEVRAKADPADWRSGPRDPQVRNGRSASERGTSGIG
ncbi:Ig-like domain-containing protein [Nocardioides renjunii]|uniref:Ig-like domain-containing protein n=1 Tax=Nocardioides renjunii TaxID=3095075 RepID=UPI002AFFA898|nr:Ig-like domain-containing protein [Nocardioides sp. S-34]WQQ24151.1 Ig-like domain-containing protein [Nocardioides sp. S-34]